MRPRWTRSLTGQLIGLMLVALALAQGVSLVIHHYDSARRLRRVVREECLGRLASAYRLALATPQANRAEALDAAGTLLSRYWLTDGPPPSLARWQEDARARLLPALAPAGGAGAVENLFTQEPMLELRSGGDWVQLAPGDWLLDLPLRFADLPEWNGYAMAVELGDRTWLNMVYAKPGYLVVSPTSPSSYAALGTVAAVFSLGTWLLARRLSRPLRRLTEAAERLGRGQEQETLVVEGPDDIRSTLLTFNRMQVRLRRFMEDRTRMLAAIGHDLRTPITLMRLRAEFVEDAETREKLLATLAEMQAMTEATLAFATSEAVTEPSRLVDVGALVASICDDVKDLGWPVDLRTEGRLACTCRPDAVRRAVRNVVENAVRYGKRAELTVEASEGQVLIHVDDQGPGIPEEQHERVFAPFVRLEASRNQNTGGTGLGLSIARSILRGHGGDVTLQNRPGTGLRVTLHLPRD